MTLQHYFSLVDTQARMALKADASKYFLGYIWWILEPLLFVGVFYVVFEIILQTGRGDFLMFLMCGKFAFVWFSKSVNQASSSIIANIGLVGRVNVPKSMFPMALVQEGVYKQTSVFLLLLVLLVFQGYEPGPSWLMLIPIAIANYLMIVACGLVGAILVCLMRDFTMLINMGMLLLMFTSGVFWDVRQLSDPDMISLILAVNPLAFILDAYRQALMYQLPVDLGHLGMIAVFFTVLAGLALAVLRKYGQLLAMKALSA